MADIYDVQTTLASLAQTAIYPNGILQNSIVNCDVRIFPGWPNPSTLDSDLSLRNVQISIFPTDISRATTRFDTQWQTISIKSPTIILTVDNINNTITVTGTVSVPQTLMIFVNGLGYFYSVRAFDTINSIAQQLKYLIPNSNVYGNVIQLNFVYSISAFISVSGVSARELAREKRIFKITIWAPTPQIRFKLGNALAELFSSTYRIVLPDGYYANLSFGGSREEDILEKVKCYRRDIDFFVEYAITQSQTDYTIAQNIININQANIIQACEFLLLSGGNFQLLNNGKFVLLDNCEYTPIQIQNMIAFLALLTGDDFLLLNSGNLKLLE